MTDAGVAAELARWFADIVRLWSSACFEWSSSPDHREAAILETLTSNAKHIVNAPLDTRGDLYRPLTLVMSALCCKLGLVPTERHWVAALRGVREMHDRLASAEPERFALVLGTPASILKELFCEALVNAGVTDRPTLLTEKNRSASLGLAVNWGLRLIIAYALLLPPARLPRSQVRDLRWVRSLVGP